MAVRSGPREAGMVMGGSERPEEVLESAGMAARALVALGSPATGGGRGSTWVEPSHAGMAAGLRGEVERGTSMLAGGTLDHDARYVLYAHYIEGATYQQVAASLGRSLRYVYRARRRGLDSLGGNGTEGAGG